jgi:hypothetical protein
LAFSRGSVEAATTEMLSSLNLSCARSKAANCCLQYGHQWAR